MIKIHLMGKYLAATVLVLVALIWNSFSPMAMAAETPALAPVPLAEGEPADPDAQFRLGMRYGKGDGVPRDDNLARQWLVRAAIAGHLQARYMLGWLYYDGRGVPQDYAKAAELFSQAASAGDADSQYMLGVLYAKGWGVERDSRRSLDWMRRAAEQGHERAKATLGNLFNPQAQKPDGK